jgi:hypothetical protein
MTIVVLLLLLTLGLGIASAMGWTPDTRDTDYGLGPVALPRRGLNDTGATPQD